MENVWKSDLDIETHTTLGRLCVHSVNTWGTLSPGMETYGRTEAVAEALKPSPSPPQSFHLERPTAPQEPIFVEVMKNMRCFSPSFIVA